MWGAISAWLVSTGITDILNWVFTKVSTLVSAIFQQKADDAAIDKSANQSVTEEQNAQTPADLDQADRDLLGGA